MLNIVVKSVRETNIKSKLKMINKFICYILMISFLYPWGKTGHRATGEIAESYLTEKTRSEISKILKDPSLAVASTWADEMRSNPDFKKYDHFFFFYIFICIKNIFMSINIYSNLNIKSFI